MAAGNEPQKDCPHHVTTQSTQPVKFSPTDRTQSPPDITLPDELWMTVLDSPCTFPGDVYLEVMLNMIKNPNVTSSHLFRADIFYDSADHEDENHGHDQPNGVLKHIKAEYRPMNYDLLGYKRTRTMVRQLIPRNPQLDRPLLQTCHLFQRLEEDDETHVVLYIPHVQREEEMPFYHPTVSKLAFAHRWRHNPTSTSENPTPNGTHGQGQLAGYQKRVHLDRIIPQKRYQDTYTRLKAKYGRRLAEQWVEVTDPGKHVFEDLGIAAFLVELWRDMYAMPEDRRGEGGGDEKLAFPGFVDIGCGNGILTYILLSEGYRGWGFDARERKTWSIFPPGIQEQLQQRLLVPEIFQSLSQSIEQRKEEEEEEEEEDSTWHNGIFKYMPGAFIISNHADELTAWTPLLAYLNNAAFIAIPCCSHDLAGSRFRAPPSTKAAKARSATTIITTTYPPERLPQQQQRQQSPTISNPNTDTGTKGNGEPTKKHHVPETGSLKRTPEQKKMSSAYSTLCSYVGSLAEEVGFAVEREVLRIPTMALTMLTGVRRKTSKNVKVVGGEWIARAEKLGRKPGSGH
ncbi:hypothetical protein B0A55_05622 [Friedmanniomyces simplex]|uniref:tRNA (uracil-O(2)-)-methyltransferase n=1 Tax=Friedmanniomyces simplex TaxID=329884 RepID=A0A4U0XC15_9PEZI|nr:hypothetical protein B0A55_05622 [Friedmanniomyces simplex]